MIQSNTELKKRNVFAPDEYILLSNWRYVEYSLLRILAGWGRSAGDWEDKLAMCRHVWLQAVMVKDLRDRLDMYPAGKVDGPIHAAFEDLMNTVLTAPSYADAMAGVYNFVMPALDRTYRNYIDTVHNLHDHPTHDVLRRILSLRDEQKNWFSDYRQRHPHLPDPAYVTAVQQKLAELDAFNCPLAVQGDPAQPCGVRTDFRLTITPGRVKDWDEAPDIMPILESRWNVDPEARRLWFAIGYCWEMGVAENQLKWIYNAHYAPFGYIYAESRHMWDESRHGNAGLRRLKEFGFEMEHVGFSSYGASGDGFLDPMSPLDVYEGFRDVTQLAEKGFIKTKRYSLDDMMIGRDEESTEMFRYDIIDETEHTEYGNQWLPNLAEWAGTDQDWQEFGRLKRNENEQFSHKIAGGIKMFLKQHRGPTVTNEEASRYHISQETAQTLMDPKANAHCEWMLKEMREQNPLRNLDDYPERPNLPMMFSTPSQTRLHVG